jgi:flagellar hook-associated protein 2
VRIAGLASGLDIDSMVKEMMKARKATADKLFQKRTTAEWQQEAFREVSTKIVDFRNNKLSSYNLSSQINAKTAAVSGNTTAISVNSVDPTTAGNMSIKVSKVATAQAAVFTLNDMTKKTGTMATLGYNSAGSFEVNGKSIQYEPTDTLKTIAAKINADKAAKATALYDENSGMFSIMHAETGKAVTADGPFASLFTRTDTGGDKAEIEVNGITFKQDSNRFSINGVDFTIKAETGATNAALAIVTDTEKTLSTIKSFVSDYNSLIEKVNGELGEERFRTFTPLTDEQKEAMTEKQIELWEEKAHSGLLRNDSTLSKLASDLRIASTADFATNINIATIGITTGAWQDKGKLIIDEAKLRKAIEDNPQQVADMFMKAGDTSDPAKSGVGIFNKMSKIAMNALTELSNRVGTSMVSADPKGQFLENSLLSTHIRDLKSKETDMAAKLKAMEDRYYKQFAAMEAAINKFNSQSSSLSSFMS